MNSKQQLGAAVVGALGLGAGLMFLLDPVRGHTRRVLIRDKAVKVSHRTKRAAAVAATDVKNHVEGMIAETKHVFQKDDVDDEILVARVRSKLGRATSHPGAVHVRCVDGTVILSGPILADEEKGLLASVKSVRGVKDVENELEPHREAGSVSALQSDKQHPPRHHRAAAEHRGSLAPRLALFGVGSGLILFGLLNGRRTYGVLSDVLGATLWAGAADRSYRDWVPYFSGKSEKKAVNPAEEAAPT